MPERKKSYTFRFSQHTNNNLTKLASAYHMDRTEVLEYIISVYSAMWIDGTKPEWITPNESNEKTVLE